MLQLLLLHFDLHLRLVALEVLRLQLHRPVLSETLIHLRQLLLVEALHHEREEEEIPWPSWQVLLPIAWEAASRMRSRYVAADLPTWTRSLVQPPVRTVASCRRPALGAVVPKMRMSGCSMVLQ